MARGSGRADAPRDAGKKPYATALRWIVDRVRANLRRTGLTPALTFLTEWRVASGFKRLWVWRGKW